MDSTYWVILTASLAAALLVAAPLAHLAAAHRAVTATLVAIGVPLLGAALAVDSRAVASTDLDPVVTVEVTAQKYSWQVRYPGTDIEAVSEIVLPQGLPARLELRATDVVHSFWLPELGVRRTVVPGVTEVVTITAPHTGGFRLLCGEFCGPMHSFMAGRVLVVEPARFREWIGNGRRG